MGAKSASLVLWNPLGGAFGHQSLTLEGSETKKSFRLGS